MINSKMVEGEKSETPVKPTPEQKGKSMKVAGIVVALVVVVVLILVLALYGRDLFKMSTTTPIYQQNQTTTTDTELISVGNPEATPTLTEEDAIETLLDETLVGDGEIGYVFCEQLDSGDKVATMGDPDKYEVSGPVWFVYIDEHPDAWFEHDTKFIFIDASTGEETTYKESWPPDINGEDMFDAAEECGGATTIYTT